MGDVMGGCHVTHAVEASPLPCCTAPAWLPPGIRPHVSGRDWAGFLSWLLGAARMTSAVSHPSPGRACEREVPYRAEHGRGPHY